MALIESGYLFLVLVGLLLAVRIIGWRHVANISSPAFWFLSSIGVAYFLRPLIFFLNDDWLEWHLTRLPSFDEIGLKYGLFIALCLAAFALGYGRSQEMSAYVRVGREKFFYGARKITIAVILAFVFFGYLLTIWYRPLPFFGEGVQMVRDSTGGAVYLETSGYLANASYVIPNCGLLYYAVSGNLWGTFLLVGPWFLCQFYYGWGRGFFLLFLVGLLGMAGLYQGVFKNRRRQMTLIAAAILVVLPILAVLGHNRYFFRQGLQSKEMLQQFEEAQGRWSSSRGSDLLGFTNSAFYLYHSGNTFPHAYCRPFLYSIFIQGIPRVLWKNKPLPQDLDPQVGAPIGMAPGPVGSVYHQLGWLGFLLFLFHGWWIKRVAVRLANLDRPSLFAGFGFLLCFPVYMADFIWVPNLAFFLGPALAVYLVERHFLVAPETVPRPKAIKPHGLRWEKKTGKPLPWAQQPERDF